MKKLITSLFAFLLCTTLLFAQAPLMFKYQTVVRNSSGSIIANQTVAFKISILQGSISGNPVYRETHHKTTNDFGLVNLEIGGGTVISGTMSAINWANGPYFTKIELDTTNSGSSYITMGTSELLSVPYALFAEKAGNNAPPTWNDILNKPTFATVATSGSYNDLSNKLVAGSGILINGSNVISTNISLQASNFGDTLFLVPGNYVIIPGLSSLNAPQPHVTTSVISTITSNTANCGYTVTMLNGPAITARGVCYGSQHFPDISGTHTTDGGGTGTYTANMTALTPNTIYYVRAYATNTNDTYYGSELMFTTSATLPSVTTADTTNVGLTTAACGGNVTDFGGATVTARGVCWSTSQNPTISNSKTIDGTGSGAFTSAISPLNPNTLYYYRAYATNSVGTGYGVQYSFTTDCAPPTVITDTIFSSGCTSAIVQCHIPSAGCASVTERGICWGTMSLPDIYGYGTKVSNGSGTGSFNFTLNTLVPNTTYRVRSYAISNSVVTYGAIKTFSVLASYYAGFETGMPSGWLGNWTASTDSPYEGFYCLKSVNVNDSTQFTLNITSTPAQFLFYHRSSQPTGSPSMITRFYINNILQNSIGDEGWNVHLYQISVPGSYTFKWINGGGGWGNVTYIDYSILCPN